MSEITVYSPSFDDERGFCTSAILEEMRARTRNKRAGYQ